MKFQISRFTFGVIIQCIRAKLMRSHLVTFNIELQFMFSLLLFGFGLCALFFWILYILHWAISAHYVMELKCNMVNA